MELPVPEARPAPRPTSPVTAVGVLIVDDRAPFRSVARRLVSLIPGWTVLGEAADGPDAVLAAARLRPELVIMDINLPGFNGVEATRRIRAAQPATTVVLVSTYGMDDLPGDLLTCGAAGYIRKEELTPAALHAFLPEPN